MAPTAGKLEMIGASDSAEHDAIKTLMVFEAADDPQTETAAIPGLRSGENCEPAWLSADGAASMHT